MAASAGTAAETEAITLDNGAAEVVIDPGIGRIVSWRLAGGENVLWMNQGSLASKYVPGWKNHGGDKLWITPQLFRPYAHGTPAPDPDLDGKPWTVMARGARSVTFRSPESAAQRVILTRTVTLDEKRPELAIENRVERIGASPLGIQLWTVTQARKPLHVDMMLSERLYPERERYWRGRKGAKASAAEAIPGGLRIRLPDGDWDKLGGWGGTLRAVYPDVAFIQRFEPDPLGCYPESATLQLYGNADYIELETYGSFRHLAPGDNDATTVRWILAPNPTLE